MSYSYDERFLGENNFASVETEPMTVDKSRFQQLADRYWYLPVFGIYALVVFWTIAHHEPWGDEAQAWLIARDTPIWEMLASVLRYEGTPPLWHVLCALLTRLGLPYEAFPYVGGLIACSGVLFFLRFAPFSRPITALLPFTYFICYQYSVVARSYVFAPLALFALAWIWQKRHERPFLFCLLIILLANLSAFGFLIAGALMLLHLISLPGARGQYSSNSWRRLACGVALYTVVCLAIIAELMPPDDGSFLAWIEERRPSETTWVVLAFVPVLYSISTNVFIVLAALVPSLILFVRRRTLHLYLIPIALCSAFACKIHVAIHHMGLYQLVWLFALWVTYELVKAAPENERKTDRLLFLGCIIPFLAGSCYASAVTIYNDIREPYCGSREAAQYIASRRDEIGSIVGFSCGTIPISPYFDEPIFENMDNCHGSSFWFWSTRQNMAVQPDEQIDMIVFATQSEKHAVLPWENPDFRFYLAPGFSLRLFDGHYFFRGTTEDRFAILVFERDPRKDDSEMPDVREIAEGYDALFEQYMLAGRYRERSKMTLRDVVRETHATFAHDLEELMPEVADLQYRIALELPPDPLDELGDPTVAREQYEAVRADYQAFLEKRERAELRSDKP